MCARSAVYKNNTVKTNVNNLEHNEPYNTSFNSFLTNMMHSSSKYCGKPYTHNGWCANKGTMQKTPKAQWSTDIPMGLTRGSVCLELSDIPMVLMRGSVCLWRTYGPDQRLCLWHTYRPDERLCLSLTYLWSWHGALSALNCLTYLWSWREALPWTVWRTYGPDKRLCLELCLTYLWFWWEALSAFNRVWCTYGPDERLYLELCLMYLWSWREALPWTVSDIPMALMIGSALNCVWQTYGPDERLCLSWTVWHTYGPDERLYLELCLTYLWPWW